MAKRIASNKAEALQQAVEGSRKGVDLENCEWLDRALVEELRIAVRQRAEIKREEEEVARKKDNVSSILSSVMSALGIDTAYLSGTGSVTSYVQSRKTLDQSRLKEELLKAGMPADILVGCFDRSTKVSESRGMRFTLG